MDTMNESCSRFLAELASKAPTPGGGGTAALVGAAGVALGNMVGCLTVGKKKYAAVEADLLTLNERAGALRAELEALVQADAEAFALVEEYAARGSALAVSDAGCAAALCKAALQAASLNVFINTKLMIDKTHAAALDAQADALLSEYVPKADTVFAQVTKQLRT